MKAPTLVLALVAAAVTIGIAAAPVGAPLNATHESKPLGPIAVDVRLVAPPTPGVPLEVIITAHAEGNAVDGLDLEVRVDDSAALVIGGRSEPIDSAGSRSWVVTVVPMLGPGGNLSVVVFGEIDGAAQAQSVTTKIRAAGAEPTVRALSTVPARAGRENLSLLPVEERF